MSRSEGFLKEIKEDNDWFDINAVVYFGIHPIPFIALKQHILHKKREFILPDGDIAIIPEKWFTVHQYSFHILSLGFYVPITVYLHTRQALDKVFDYGIRLRLERTRVEFKRVTFDYYRCSLHGHFGEGFYLWNGQ